MKILVLASVSFLSCASTDDSPSTIEKVAPQACESGELRTGVICSYFYSKVDPVTFRGWRYDVNFDANNVRKADITCTWDLTCIADTFANSDAGEQCASTIGTGCNAGTVVTSLTKKYEWIDETKYPGNETGAKAFCDDQVTNDRQTMLNTCVSLSKQVEQYEDLCCVAEAAR